MQSTCPKCKSAFTCEASINCWCASLPPIYPIVDGESCLCPTCLKSAVIKKADEMIQSKSFLDIQELGPVTSPVEGLDYTINHDGNLVFSTWYHLRRGSCCGSGCLHCPYEHENV